MSGRITVWGASQLLTSYFTKLNEPPPSFYLALVRNIAPTPYMDGSELDEPDSVDYARIEIPNDTLNWANDSAPQEVYNLLPQQFITATTDWGQINYWALCNALVDGYNFVVGDLENPVLIHAGDQAVFSEGDLSLSLGPFFMVEDDS
jgi:hypothetical protein